MAKKIRKPVVALDVDGALNAFRMDQDNLLPGWEKVTVDVPTDQIPDSPFLPRVPEDEATIPITMIVNPGLHGPWINSLRERASVVWATTWEGMANAALCEVLGIESLPVGISVFKQYPRLEEVRKRLSPQWKGHALNEAFGKRELCWVDDLNFIGLSYFKGPRYLGVTTDSAVGLTAEQMEEVDRWVAGGGVDNRDGW